MQVGRVVIRTNALAFAGMSIGVYALTVMAYMASKIWLQGEFAGEIIVIGTNIGTGLLALAATMLKPDDPPNPLAAPLNKCLDIINAKWK